MTIFTDNKDFTFNPHNVSSRAQKWKALLNEFTTEVKDVAGKDNPGADFLSRDFAINIFPSMSRCLLDAQEQYLIVANYLRKIDVQGNEWLLSEDKRIIVPYSFTPYFLKKLRIELGHPGVTKLRSTMSPYFEVMGIDKAVATVCLICTGCT